jgi:hypothetical protein
MEGMTERMPGQGGVYGGRVLFLCLGRQTEQQKKPDPSKYAKESDIANNKDNMLLATTVLTSPSPRAMMMTTCLLPPPLQTSPSSTMLTTSTQRHVRQGQQL